MTTAKSIILSLAAALAMAGVASAQVPRGMGPVSTDIQRRGNDNMSERYNDGVVALQAKNYAVAESIFKDVLRQQPKHADANFMMGVLKMSQEKWAEAKPFLDMAAKANPKSPDPKSRLGVTLIKLGDMEGAAKQRAELEKMNVACKDKCRNAEWIKGGLAMIDSATGPAPPPAP